ncbi:oligopeptide ABC transporter permease [Aquibacillus kalidii]|uniref:oligopeptide ABC transporter permease n=1 Tax=Aquibacillus kalidii TaxID=2762597 RepID=UPI0016462279|nr:oligopeptide ABC transporter permease [Aquibacillus kalidii]
MGKYIISRFSYMLITFLVIASLTFFLMHALPGTPYGGAQGKVSPEQLERLDARYGLDKPLPVQYVKYIGGIFKGDLGVSFQFQGREVATIISEKIGASATLGAEAIIFGTILGIILGVIAALKHNTILDYGSMVIAVLGISIPAFVFAALLQYYFAVKWPILPVAYWEGPKYHILPAISLAVGVLANISRFMRTELMEVLGQDYILMARAKGLSSTSVIVKHSVRNALIPVITILGPMTVNIMTGSLVIEQIFAINGLGEQFVTSIMTNDYPMVMGTTLFYSALFIGVIFLVDVLYGVIDPRIRLGGGKA